MDRDGIVSLSADYSTEDRLNRNRLPRGGNVRPQRDLQCGGEQHPKGQIQREVKEPVPRVMWRSCLPSDDEFDGVPAALAVLHQDRHRILPTRQRAGQWLARSFRLLHPFYTTSPTNSHRAFSWPLVDSGQTIYYNTVFLVTGIYE